MAMVPNPFNGLTTRAEVADLIGVSNKQLMYLLYARHEEKRYSSFFIPKRKGGQRLILAPRDELKFIQHTLAAKLVELYTPRTVVHGFTCDRSIVSNAKCHVGRRFVLNVDIKDFFPSIHFGRVQGLFASSAIGARGQAATVLAQICCHKRALPAGAPTSPVLSNMVCARLDRELIALAKKYKCHYSRYADDLTFSKKRGAFPPELAYIGLSESAVVGDELRAVIESNGFQVHVEKVRLFKNTYRQNVTGLVVNEKVNVQRRFIRQIRAMIHAWEAYGLEEAEKEYHHKYWHDASPLAKPPEFAAVVRGKLEFVKMVRGASDPVYRHLQTRLVKANPDYLEVMEEENLQMNKRDFFISHASEDKDEFVRPLALALIAQGKSVWYDEYEIQVGDSIRERIDDGLARSSYGVVVLSPNFFLKAKMWPKRELDGLVSAEDASGKRVILPVWYKLTVKDVRKQSLTLAGIRAIDASKTSLDDIVAQLVRKLQTTP